MTASIRELVNYYQDLWWESATSLPDLGPSYTSREQAAHEKELEQLLKQLNQEVANPPRSQQAAQELQKRLEGTLTRFATQTFGVGAEQFALLPTTEFSTAAQDFIRQARAFDPQLDSEDIYQAGRNAWTANGLQWLLSAPVNCSPSIFAYSMLYPYTDNYLDDAAIPTSTKLAFNEHFRQRLAGETTTPANKHEEIIFKLVDIIEKEYARSSYPAVFESLLDIDAGQAKSLRLVRPKAAPGEVDVLGISLEKGGASVLADGYLINGNLDPAGRKFCFGFGVFAQLLDDLEDVQADMDAGRQTLYSQPSGHWTLDALTNRTIHFGGKILEQLDNFEAGRPLKQLIWRGTRSIFVDTASRVPQFYSSAYLQTLEAHSPFRFAFLNKQRKDFARRNGSLVKLIETFAPRGLDRFEFLPGVTA